MTEDVPEPAPIGVSLNSDDVSLYDISSSEPCLFMSDISLFGGDTCPAAVLLNLSRSGVENETERRLPKPPEERCGPLPMHSR